VVPQQMSDVLGEFARTVVTDFSVVATLERLVARAVHALPVSSAAVSLLTPGGEARCLAASDSAARLCAEQQSALGEGPGLRACQSDRPTSMGLDATEQFPGLAAAALGVGVTAGMSFPLRQGPDVVGSLDLYQEHPATLDPASVHAAQTLADVAAAYVMIAQDRIDSDDASERARRSSAHDDASVLALRTSEQRTAAVLASVLDAVITIDAAGRVLEFNPAAERMFGRLERDATDRDLFELLSPPAAMGDRWIGIDRYLAEHTEPLIGRRIELTGTRADGEAFPAEVSITAVDGPGPQLFTAFIRDLTRRVAADAERRDLESRMQQSERLASLGQLAGGVAHDFNNLLTVIVNYASFIAESTTNDDDTRAQAVEIVASAERGAGLTKQLLLFARREPVQRTPLDIRQVVRDVRELLVQAVGEAIEVVIVEADDLPLVTGDRGQLEQVLMNLAVNARDAMPDGGTLTIETSLARAEGGAGAACVQLRVTDGGEGMDDEVVARAFDPFFTTKSSGQGSGLGLATVYGIVFDAGGTIELTSTPGHGTTFRVRLPVPADVTEDVVAPAMSSPVAGTGETILVVEDEVPVRKVIVAMLRRNGYEVVETADAPAALELASGTRFDLLLTDIVMPGLSGRDLVAELRRRRPLQRVLYMSGYSGGAFGAQRALDPGEAIIHKPFKERDLLTAVHAALGPVGAARVAVGAEEPIVEVSAR
jgi:two-component system cell cycle sensor histidine kinase/response regulator CckA